MPTLNEQRIRRCRNGLFPFKYEGGTIKPFRVYYVVEEWYRKNDNWDWYPICLTTKENYERFKKTGECYYGYYGNRV